MSDPFDPDLPLLLTPTEVCRHLGIGTSRFNQFVASGELPVVRLGGRRRVRADELVRFVEGLSRPGRQQNQPPTATSNDL